MPGPGQSLLSAACSPWNQTQRASSGTAPVFPFLSEVLPEDCLKRSVLRHNQLSFGELGFPSWTQIVANPLSPCLPSRTVVGSGVNIERNVERNGFLVRIVPVLHRYCSCLGFILTSWNAAWHARSRSTRWSCIIYSLCIRVPLVFCWRCVGSAGSAARCCVFMDRWMPA